MRHDDRDLVLEMAPADEGVTRDWIGRSGEEEGRRHEPHGVGPGAGRAPN